MENDEIVVLVQSWQQEKNQDAVNKLYNGIKPFLNYLIVRPYAYNIDAEFILNDALFSAINHYNANSGKFTSYLAAVFRNAVVSAKRRRAAKTRQEYRNVGHYDSNLLKEEDLVDSISLIESHKLDLIDIIEKLPEREQNIVRLYLEGNSWADIRKKYGYAKSTMSNLTARLIAQMKESF